MGFPYLTCISSINCSTAAFSANQVIGTGVNAITPRPPPGGFIQGVVITAKSTVSAQIDVIILPSSMPNTTFTDHSSIAISTADVVATGPIIHVTDWSYGGTTASIGQAMGLAYTYCAGSHGAPTDVYFALVARAALTVNSTNDIAVTFNIVS